MRQRRARSARAFCGWPWPADLGLGFERAGTRFGRDTHRDLRPRGLLDMGYQAGQNHPDWFDVVRPTKLPAFEDEFGKDGHWFSSVRQSRLGVKTFTPTSLGELKTIFRVRALRHRHGRRADHLPAAPRLRRAGPVRRRPDVSRSWTSTCSRTRWSTGARTAWCSSATCRCAGMPIQGDTRLTVPWSAQAPAVTPASTRALRR